MRTLYDITEADERGVCPACGGTMLDDDHGGAKCYYPRCPSRALRVGEEVWLTVEGGRRRVEVVILEMDDDRAFVQSEDLDCRWVSLANLSRA